MNPFAAQDQIDYSTWLDFIGDIAEIGTPALEQMRLDITTEINTRGDRKPATVSHLCAEIVEIGRLADKFLKPILEQSK